MSRSKELWQGKEGDAIRPAGTVDPAVLRARQDRRKTADGKFKMSRKENWRRGPGSNRRIKVLQTSPLPLGYRALAGLPTLGTGPDRRSQPGRRRRAVWSGRRDLNSRPSPWQGDALPLSYSRLNSFQS